MSGRARPARRRRADLSQHFLRDACATRLIRRTSLSGTDLVVEIGAGRGALTRPLATRAGRVIAVEVDPHLARRLTRSLGSAADVVNADVLGMALPERDYCVVGNIPYSITTEIVRKLTNGDNPPRDAWLVVQKELAQRLCGRPYCPESLWSLKLKPCWHLEIVDRLRRTDFDPPPRIDSVLLWMNLRNRPLLSPEETALYLDLVGSTLSSGAPLKQALRPWLSKLQTRRLAADLRFDGDDRASSLEFAQWLGILRFLQD